MRLLLETTSVAAIVGARIYIGELPQGFSVPCVLLTPVWEAPEYHVPGFAHAYVARTQIQCVGKGSTAALELSNAIRDALIEVANEDVFDGGSPPVKMGIITLWKLGTSLHDVGEDRLYHRRVTEFKSRWIEP